MRQAERIQTVEDARRIARRRLPRMIFDFVDGAAGDEMAMQLAQSALQDIRLQPRVLINVEGRNLSTELLGTRYQLPFGIAPMGMAGLAWPGADRDLANLARERAMPVGISTAASMSFTHYRQIAGDMAWFQLYFTGSAQATLDLAKRVADSGYRNLVFTVDTPILSHRPREFRSGFKHPFRFGLRQVVDCALHPQWALSMLFDGIPSMQNFTGDEPGFDRHALRGTLDYTFLDQLRRLWPGNLIVKGVAAREDAQSIKQAGADAIWVSTHGGRQLDGAPAAISLLPPIRQQVGESYPLIFDGGVRSGESVVKALAMGANFVMLGRPFLYALGAGGNIALHRVTDLLADDVDRTLAQIGRTDVTKLDGSVLA